MGAEWLIRGKPTNPGTISNKYLHNIGAEWPIRGKPIQIRDPFLDFMVNSCKDFFYFFLYITCLLQSHTIEQYTLSPSKHSKTTTMCKKSVVRVIYSYLADLLIRKI